MTLRSIAKMARRSLEELLENLPPPSTVIVDRDAVQIWPISEVTALLPEMEERDIDRLMRQRDDLEKTIRRLEGTAGDLEAHVNRLRREMRSIRPARDRIEVSMKQGMDAFWTWNPPTPAPEIIRGVYRLIQKGKTVYIGQSGNITNRILDHAVEREFDEFAYARVGGDREVLNEVESALIIIERPPWNHGNDGRLRHPTGHGWSQEEAQAVLDKYRAATARAEDEGTA